MSRRLASLLALIAGLLGLAAASVAEERGSLSVTTSLTENTAIAGNSFEVRVIFSYTDVDSDKIVGIRLTAPFEDRNISINRSVSEQDPCRTPGHKRCTGRLDATFTVAFGMEIFPENQIIVDGYSRTRDRKSQHFMADATLKIKMIPRTRLEVLSVDAPKPPETVQVGEQIPIRMTVQCVSMLPQTDLFCSIQAVEGGTGYWSWRSPQMSGSSRYVSEPQKIVFDRPGRWKLQAKAKTEGFVAEPLDFEVEVVDAPTRVLGPVRIGYPKPPETVGPGEKVRFDVSFDYKSFPAGTTATVLFIDAATGKDIPNAWLESHPLRGNGTYDFGPVTLSAPGPGTWDLDVAIRLPRIDVPGEYNTYYTKRLSLQVASGPAAPAWKPSDMTAEITEIRKPSGSLKLNEIAPIFVTIRYEKIAAPGAVFKAVVLERGTTNALGRADSIALRDQGSYTFPVIDVKMPRTGSFQITVEVRGPNNRLLAGKWTDFTVVD